MSSLNGKAIGAEAGNGGADARGQGGAEARSDEVVGRSVEGGKPPVQKVYGAGRTEARLEARRVLPPPARTIEAPAPMPRACQLMPLRVSILQRRRRSELLAGLEDGPLQPAKVPKMETKEGLMEPKDVGRMEPKAVGRMEPKDRQILSSPSRAAGRLSEARNRIQAAINKGKKRAQTPPQLVAPGLADLPEKEVLQQEIDRLRSSVLQLQKELMGERRRSEEDRRQIRRLEAEIREAQRIDNGVDGNLPAPPPVREATPPPAPPPPPPPAQPDQVPPFSGPGRCPSCRTRISQRVVDQRAAATRAARPQGGHDQRLLEVMRERLSRATDLEDFVEQFVKASTNSEEAVEADVLDLQRELHLFRCHLNSICNNPRRLEASRLTSSIRLEKIVMWMEDLGIPTDAPVRLPSPTQHLYTRDNGDVEVVRRRSSREAAAKANAKFRL